MAHKMNNNPRGNFDEHWAGINHFLFPEASEVVGHFSEGLQNIWLTTELWKPIDERKGFKGQSMADDGQVDPLRLQYHVNFQEVELNKRESVIVLVRQTEAAADSNDFRTVYRIIKELACDCNLQSKLL